MDASFLVLFSKRIMPLSNGQMNLAVLLQQEENQGIYATYAFAL